MEQYHPTKKYALMKLEEFIGYDYLNSSRITRPFAYIVAECYLLNEKIRVLSNGKKIPIYDVVFTWNPCDEKEVFPYYTHDGKCINKVLVDRVFDNIDDAIEYRTFRNNDLRISNMMRTNIYNISKDQTKIYEEEKAFLSKIEIAYELERKHLPNIKDKVKELKKY